MGRRGFAVVLTTVVIAGLGTSTRVGASAQTYRNPVSKTFAETFADPSVIKAKYGYWYA